MRREWLQGQEGLIVLSGARARRRPGAGSRQCRHGAVAGAPVGPTVSGFVLHRIAARRLRRRRNLYPGRHAAGRQAGLPVVATHPVQFLDRDEFQAHEARVCIAEGRSSPIRGGCGATRRTNTCSVPRNGAPLRRRALGAGQYGRDRAALQPDPGAGASRACRTSPRRTA